LRDPYVGHPCCVSRELKLSTLYHLEKALKKKVETGIFV